MTGYHGGTKGQLSGQVWVALDRSYAEATGAKTGGADGYKVHEIDLDGLRILDMSHIATEGFYVGDLAEAMREGGVPDEYCDELAEEYRIGAAWEAIDGYDCMLEGLKAAGYEAVMIAENAEDCKIEGVSGDYVSVCILNYQPAEA